MPVFEPATITWSNGQTVTLSREGDIVTALVDPHGAADLLTQTKPFPADHFKPVGTGQLRTHPAANYLLTVWDGFLGQPDGIDLTPAGAAPFLPGTVRWLADPIPGANWPITAGALRTALQIGPTDEDTDELNLFAAAACERIDQYTGRDIDPARHEITPGKLPTIFILAARETAKLWWQQTKNGPRNRPAQGPDSDGAPAGIDLPRKVQGWLASYPPRVYREPTT
ncbi:head-tail connector protein [Microbacterium sp. J1-1]|uniref:head-tail connector protein n=1 Tax=Microbacterium sp. J1-1 TaxID=2992441 RepID=UPI0021148166|nr:head-tail connector protein [Microbacterium sp. J1-1]UUE19328.1 phage gp6-like head-tail connector protein [Microbacterium sp. J1-1]